MPRDVGSGDGWVRCAQGHRHWGRFGAAGLLLGAAGRSLLQHRAPWTHEGGTWGVPGGARDRGEDVVTAALREAHEEGGLDPADTLPLGWSVADHDGWAYTTVVTEVPAGRQVPTLAAANAESVEIRWWPDDDVASLPLHAGFGAAWPALRDRPAPLAVVVDVANVVGSRPDGWWRDRAGAATRLWAGLTAVAAAGVGADQVPSGVDPAGLGVLTPRIHLVLEGRFRAAVPPDPADPADPADRSPAWARPLVQVDHASGQGDDAILARAARLVAAGRDQVLVVTADRELRRRVESAGALTTGPTWLLARLPATR